MIRRYIFLLAVLFLSAGIVPVAAAAAALDSWTAQSPYPTSNSLNDVAFLNNTYVAVGNKGTIVTSSDGASWTSRTPATTQELKAVAYGGGKYVAVGAKGTIVTSSDGATWTSIDISSITTNWLYGIAYGNSKFVAVGSNGTILTSSDGATWTSCTSNTSQYLEAVAYGNSKFVAAGRGGTILTSPDGVIWTSRTSGTTNDINAVAYINGKFVGVLSDGRAFSSMDGLSWTSTVKGNGNGMDDVAYGNGTYVVVGGGIQTSGDLTGFTSRTSGTSSYLNGVTYANGMFIAVGGGAILTSLDGVNWTNLVVSGEMYAIVNGGGKYVTVGVSGAIATSGNGAIWTTRTSGTTDWLFGITYGTGAYVAVGSSGRILTSSDGTSWTPSTSGTAQSLRGVAYGNGTYVAVGDYGTILTSSSGVSWTPRTVTTNSLSNVAYVNDKFIAMSGGTKLTSSNGVSWTSYSSTGNAKSVAYGNGTYVAVGASGAIQTSSDGTNWTSRTSVTTNDLTGVSYGSGTYVAVGKSGTILTSGDGVSWTNTTGITGNFDAVTYSNGAFVTVGYWGAILSAETIASADNYIVSADLNEVTAGQPVMLTATGDRQSATGLSVGAAKYIPTSWTSTESGKSGTFSLSGGSYSSSYTTTDPGSHTVTASFKKQTWDGSIWVDNAETDTKTAAVKVYTPAHTISASAAATAPGVGGDDAITLTVKDWQGNVDTTFNGAHSVTISGYSQAPDDSYGSFNGTVLDGASKTIDVTFTSGTATANLKLNKAGAQTIDLSVAGVTTPAANTLSITPAAGSAATLALTTDITAPVSNGGVFAQQPVAVLRDVYGNTSTGNNTTVVTVSKKDTGDWTLTGTKTVTASSGVVIFTVLGATNKVELTGAQLAFSATGMTSISSTTVTLPAPAPAQTVSASADKLTPGVGLDDAITLTVKDSLGNKDTMFSGAHNVTISGYVKAPDDSYGSLGGTELVGSSKTISVEFTGGAATVNLKLNKAGAQTIILSVAGVTTPAANTMSLTPAAGSAVSMALTTDIVAPISNGGAFAQQPVAVLSDVYGNTSTGNNTTVVTVSKKDTGDWTLTGTKTVTASSGVVSFTVLGATNKAELTGAQLAFSATGLTSISSTTVTLPAPAPAQTVSASADKLTPGVGLDDAITLTVKDSLGNKDTMFSGAHNVTISGYVKAPDDSYGSLNGTDLVGSPKTISVEFTGGAATVNLKLNKAGAQTISLSVAGVATPAANTLSLTPAAGSAVSMALTTDIVAPISNGGAFAQQPVAVLSDVYGNTSTGNNTTVVTVSKKDTGDWTLTGTKTVTASSGVVIFTVLGATNKVELTGAQLAFSATGLTSISSTTVTLPAPAPAQTVSASADKLTPGVGLDDAITLTVKDSLGNKDTMFSGAHNVTISGYVKAPDDSYGSLNGTDLVGSPKTISVEFTGGAATVNLKLNKAGAQTIGLSVAGVATPAANTLSLTAAAGSAVSMALTTDIVAPISNGGAFAQQPVVTLRDVYGNTSTGDSTTVVTVSKKDTEEWTLTGTKSVTVSSGVATFTGLGATNAAEITGAQLAFSTNGLTQIKSATITLSWPDAAAPSVESVTAGDTHVILTWSEVYGSVSYAVYQRTATGTYGTAVATVTGSVYDIEGLTNGTTYYFVVKATNPRGDSALSNEVSATPKTVPLAPTGVTAAARDGQAAVSFTVPEVNGGSAIIEYEVTASPGNITATGAASPITVTGLANGTTYTFTVKAKNSAGFSAASAASNAVTPILPSSNAVTPTLPSSSVEPAAQTTANTEVQILVNGKAENVGTVTTIMVNEQTVTMISIDPKKLEDKLSAEGQNAVITISTNTKSDVVVGELNGQMVKSMEQKQAVIEIKTENATYTLPAQQINIGAVSDQLGKSVQLQDIKVQIEISKPTADTVKIVENSAANGKFTIVAPPLNFTVRTNYGNTLIEVSKFNAYVERSIAIPDGTDPGRITTGVVVEPDGTVRHVPTRIAVIDGKYFAKVDSLTNSTYAVVWHPVEFKDVAQHWAKDAVNDMGSRMVINGNGNGMFIPDQDITRAEFAAIIVRGLGLKPESGSSPFSDVKTTDWYGGAVYTAYAYKLIRGFEDGTFRPMDKITREQAMAIIATAMKISGLGTSLQASEAGNLLSTFTDANNASEWATNSIAECLQAGIISGRNGTELAPQANISRAEVAAIVQRLLKKSELI